MVTTIERYGLVKKLNKISSKSAANTLLGATSNKILVEQSIDKLALKYHNEDCHVKESRGFVIGLLGGGNDQIPSLLPGGYKGGQVLPTLAHLDGA